MKKNAKALLFAYSTWDIVPVLAAFAQAAYLALLFYSFGKVPWYAFIAMGLVWSVSISWNINGVSHNFLHNAYFKFAPLNKLFSILESLLLGFSQTFYDTVHRRHHMGNSDRPDDHGEVVDWLSIYRHGHEGEAEGMLSYVFLTYFRDDPKKIYAEIYKRSPSEARFGVLEIVLMVAFYAFIGFLNWRFLVCFLPFYYFGHCLSNLNGYFLHYGGNPDVPVAWGVSCYERIYNFLWFNNGYHAEHHFRPRHHWTKMRELHLQIQEQQKAAGTHVIIPPHALGFLDPHQPPRELTKLNTKEWEAAIATPNESTEPVASGMATTK
ncbi:MAG TPA: fatty acid desaturase [Phycisphaerae bacterium]|nr:fatty acid desaturase [Phycisphaerae bacterium]